MYGIENLTEMHCLDAIKMVFEENPDLCQCDDCKGDMLCYMLNRLPNKHIRTVKGRLLSDGEFQSIDRKVEMLTLASQASVVVKENTNHPLNG